MKCCLNLVYIPYWSSRWYLWKQICGNSSNGMEYKGYGRVRNLWFNCFVCFMQAPRTKYWHFFKIPPTSSLAEFPCTGSNWLMSIYSATFKIMAILKGLTHDCYLWSSLWLLISKDKGKPQERSQVTTFQAHIPSNVQPPLACLGSPNSLPPALSLQGFPGC